MTGKVIKKIRKLLCVQQHQGAMIGSCCLFVQQHLPAPGVAAGATAASLRAGRSGPTRRGPPARPGCRHRHLGTGEKSVVDPDPY
jgi:hypothetical protein